MTKTYRFLLFGLASLSLLTACVDYDDATTEVGFKVKIGMPANFRAGADLSGNTVTLTQGSRTYSATTNAEGVATFSQLIPDVYSIAAAWEVDRSQYLALTGDTVQNSFTISGSSINYLVDGRTDTLLLNVTASENQSLIISKVYASGSKDGNNRNYQAGKYIEFYNNSDDTIDIAGLYFGLAESGSAPAYPLGLTPDYVYLKQAYRFPATAPILVAPGATVIVANSAIDHTANNAPLEHNLLDADFEAKDASGKTVNNPATPAVELAYTFAASVTQMNLVQGGPTTVVLFTATEAEVNNWERSYVYGKTSGIQYLRLPIANIKDGIDILKYSATSINTANKRLYNFIDAGYTTITNASGWNGEVLYRRTSNITSTGRRVLTDTNNSSNDITVSSTIAPRAYE